MSRLKGMRGFTLVELMITIALLGVVATIAVPNFVQFIRNNQVQAKADELKTFLQYARGQACTLVTPVTRPLIFAVRARASCDHSQNLRSGYHNHRLGIKTARRSSRAQA